MYDEFYNERFIFSDDNPMDKVPSNSDVVDDEIEDYDIDTPEEGWDLDDWYPTEFDDEDDEYDPFTNEDFFIDRK